MTLKSCVSICLGLLLLSQPVAAGGLYQYQFSNTDGQAVALSDYKDKVVVLNFWATWCPPCIKEMPSMQRLKEAMSGQPFEIIAVNAGESETAVSSFLLELDTELTFPILLDETGTSFGDLGLRGLPTTLIYNRSGEKVETVLGGREWDSRESISRLQELAEER